ncbi:helicase-related protein [Marinagarivorans algicola]|uniref:helicase-related protein n=1 Tax=Marinagarivorans algicola TaxID=1513270 RepID=UPI0037360485
MMPALTRVQAYNSMNLLPIDKIQSDFALAIKTHHLVVQAETGSGKSTRLPLWAKANGKVLVVEPRRVACTALAEYVAQLDNTPLGEGVGYAIRFDAKFKSDTQVIFVTPGIALRWLSDNGLRDFKTIIIDEFHERRWDTDLLLALLKQKNQSNAQNHVQDNTQNHAQDKDSHRIVLTSATFNSQQLSDYLGGQRLISEGRSFPVSVEYLSGNVQAMPEQSHLDTKVRSAVEQALARQPGDILVFLPGRREIAACQSTLQTLTREYPALNIIALHAAETKHNQQQALTTSAAQTRKVVLATNIAETSLTIPGVTIVIDSGLERRTHQRGGRTVLSLQAISQASAEQRKGRAGRTQAGLCLRLYGEFASLVATTPPELLREDLVEPMLAAASCGEVLGLLSLPSTLPAAALTRARDKLINMQAIDDDGAITEHGKVLSRLPLDTLFAHLITAMPTPVLRCAMVDVACALSQTHRLIQLPNTEGGHKILKQWQAHACDISTLISLMRSHTMPSELQVDSRALVEAKVMANTVRQQLALPAIKDTEPYTFYVSHLNALQQAITAAMPELVFVRRQKRRQALGNGYSEVSVGRDSRFAEDAEAAIVLDQHIIPAKGTKQNLALATCMSPITLKQMCQWQLGDVSLKRTFIEKGKILVETKRTYAGREIERTQSPPNKALLPFALSELILRNKVFPKVAAQLHADLHAWAIYLNLEKRTDEVPEPGTYLANKLMSLGLETVDDIPLIDAGDLAFDGVPDWQRAAIDEQYPQHLALANLQLKMDYQLDKKTVIMERVAGLRKTDPKRWELPKWQGLKIRYKVASRVVDVR